MCTPAPRRRGTPILVLVILALLAGTALYLRTWRLDYDKIHPDDPKQILAAREFVRGDYLFGLNRRNKYIRGYPYFAMHLIEWTYGGYERVLNHVTTGAPLPHLVMDYKAFDIFLRRIGLMLNCFYEMVSLGLVFLIGRRLFDAWVGLAAAAVFALSLLHIQTTHMIGADLPGSVFVLGVFFFCARLRDRERIWDWIGAGACAGFAAAAKYSGLLSLLAPGLVLLELRQRAGWQGFFRPRLLAGPLAVFAAFAAAFVLGTPSIILAPKPGIDAVLSALQASKDFRIPDEFAGRRLAFVVSIWYSHLNNFLRFFEPLPGWLTLASLWLFVARRRLRESFLWVYPLALFPVAAYGFPVAVAYHYLCVFLPLTWVVGFALVEALRALKKRWFQVPSAVLFGGWALVAAVSDTAVFTLPTSTHLAERWLADCVKPGLFELPSPQLARKQNYPRMFGVDLEDFLPSARAERAVEAAELKPVVASFDIEERTPTLNHIRNRPHRIRWFDGRQRDVELFPPPRRATSNRKEVVFPGNLVFSRTPALMAVDPSQTQVRHIRPEEGEVPWLLYAHYPARSTGREKARLRLEHRGTWRAMMIGKGGDLFVELDLRRTDVLYNGVFSTVRLRSDEPVVVWLVSPRERGWFLVQMERWQDLAAWERTRTGWKSKARLAIAARHLGGGLSEGDAAVFEASLPGFRTGDPVKLFEQWTEGIDLGIYADPRPEVALKKFAAETADAEAAPPELPPGSRLARPLEQLVPGFYRITWEVSGSGGAGELEYRVTGGSGSREAAGALTSLLPQGRLAVSVPLRITASSPGWDLEFLVVNKGSAPIRLEAVRVENDPERQLRWWLEELTLALGSRRPS